MIEHTWLMWLLANPKIVVMLGLVMAMGGFAWWHERRGGQWQYRVVVALAVANTVIGLFGCDAPINPVRYQTVPVLVTRPCYAGVAPPAEAVEISAASCPGKYAECVRDTKADIQELQREAKQYRQLFKECAK
jgi:hypothetical protein